MLDRPRDAAFDDHADAEGRAGDADLDDRQVFVHVGHDACDVMLGGVNVRIGRACKQLHDAKSAGRICETQFGDQSVSHIPCLGLQELIGQRPEDFGLERGRNLSDRIAAAWQAARGHWMLFKTYVDDLRASDPGTSVTRQRWVLPLLDVLGYQLAFNASAYTIEGRSYAISHRAGQYDDAPPVHVEGIRTSLDARPPSGRPRLSPHALVQEYLNSTEHLWGIVTNGERLRLLRDSSRFTRPAYVEFDLRAMFEGEKFSEFALLYRLLHRSRLPQDSSDAASCLLEKYHQQAVESGGRVREKLRDGVELALRTLGSSLLEHPANAALRAKLVEGRLTPLAYYRQLLKLIYRLLFLMVVEERGLIATGTRRLTAAEDDPFEIASVQSFDALLSALVRGPSVSDRLKIYSRMLNERPI